MEIKPHILTWFFQIKYLYFWSFEPRAHGRNLVCAVQLCLNCPPILLRYLKIIIPRKVDRHLDQDQIEFSTIHNSRQTLGKWARKHSDVKNSVLPPLREAVIKHYNYFISKFFFKTVQAVAACCKTVLWSNSKLINFNGNARPQWTNEQLKWQISQQIMQRLPLFN